MPRITTPKMGRRHKPCSICRKEHAPWWNASKGRWFLSVETETPGKYRQVNLGPDHDEALARWHRIEAGLEAPEKTVATAPSGVGDAMLVGDLIDAFLVALKPKIRPKRYATTRRILLRFARSFGADPVGKMRVGGVPRIESWLAAQTTWTSKPDVIQRIRHLFNWGTAHGYIISSPVKALEKGKYGQRVHIFTPEQQAAILAACNPQFGQAFLVLILTGCRPDEICSLEDTDVHDDASGYYLLVRHKNQRHTGKPRRVFLVPEAAAIVREQTTKHKGRLFRSANKTKDGSKPPLSPEYFNKAMRDLLAKPELEALGLNTYKEVGGKKLYDYVPYCARHTFAVRYLTGFYRDREGRPIILNYGEVAALLGNSAKMVEQIYGHLVDQTAFLTNRLCGRV